MKKHFTREHQDWEEMNDDFQVYIKPKFDNLNETQKLFFFMLVDLFIGVVDVHLGTANFGRLDVQWSCNPIIRLFIQLLF
jgi:hypothetical protein